MLGIIMEEVNRCVEKSLRHSLKNNKDWALRRAVDYRTRIIKEWFGNFNGEEFYSKDANIGDVIYTSRRLKGSLIISTWTESDYISKKQTAEKWRSKYGGNLPSNEYVANLMFDQGIIGLPQYATVNQGYTGLGWKNGVNLYFHQATPLTTVIQDNPLWNVYEKEVEDRILSEI